jgi:hypothetical protein
MPLTDEQAEKLDFGRIVYVKGMLNPTGKYKVEPHYAIILSSLAQIVATRKMRVVVISTNDDLEKQYIVPAPLGLQGNVICSWRQEIHELQIDEIYNINQPPLGNGDMGPILKMIERHRLDTKPKKKK